MASDPVEGYVFASGRLRHALKLKNNKVARYYKGGNEGVWCGKKISSTFFAHPWNTLSYDELMQRIEFFKELDRLMPELTYWYGSKKTYQCRACGIAVVDRIIHWRWHNQGAIMLETLNALFPTVEANDESRS